jgi:hypothetical protein
MEKSDEIENETMKYRPYFMKTIAAFAGTAFFFSLPAAGAEKIHLAPHTFSLPKGYSLKPVAAAPLVDRPIHMYFDDEGALYVTDSSGDSRKAPVQVKEPSHRILRLTDRDGDGVFDHSTVFAEKVW